MATGNPKQTATKKPAAKASAPKETAVKIMVPTIDMAAVVAAVV